MSDLDSKDFAKKIAEPGTILLDVRTPEEFSAGHLASAINIDYYASDFRSQITKLNQSANFAIYCRSGKRSGDTAQFMLNSGFKSVFNLAEGILDWQEKGFPVIK